MKEDKNFSATGGVATRAGFLNARERRSVSDLLRHLAHPARLRNNAIARRYFRNGTAAGEAYIEGLRRLKRAIATALVQLSPRQRTIIEQCDLGGELNSAVTRRLAISEGHFYRERQRALSAIGLYLISDVHERQTIAILPDAFTAASAQVALLQQLGDFARAIDKLHRITAGLTDSEQRVIAHCHLAELYSDAGQPGKAFEHSETASMLASQAHTKNEAMQLCAAAAHVTAQQLANEEVKGTPTATGLLVKLRAALHNGLGTPTREAFITIALLLAEQEIERGNPQMAAALCDEALSVSRSDDSIRPIFEHRAARWQTAAKCRILSTAHELTFAVAQSVGDLTCLVGSAVQTGQIVEACASAATLASLLRFVGRADEAVLILAPLVGTVLNSRPGTALRLQFSSYQPLTSKQDTFRRRRLSFEEFKAMRVPGHSFADCHIRLNQRPRFLAVRRGVRCTWFVRRSKGCPAWVAFASSGDRCASRHLYSRPLAVKPRLWIVLAEVLNTSASLGTTGIS